MTEVLVLVVCVFFAALIVVTALLGRDRRGGQPVVASVPAPAGLPPVPRCGRCHRPTSGYGYEASYGLVCTAGNCGDRQGGGRGRPDSEPDEDRPRRRDRTEERTEERGGGWRRPQAPPAPPAPPAPQAPSPAPPPPPPIRLRPPVPPPPPQPNPPAGGGGAQPPNRPAPSAGGGPVNIPDNAI